MPAPTPVEQAPIQYGAPTYPPQTYAYPTATYDAAAYQYAYPGYYPGYEAYGYPGYAPAAPATKSAKKKTCGCS
uniref:Uncharacterized protein n=1 Tax=Chromera velia CCMP2878 TaxID=1169474 RepID=A0A0G4H224_9ALVE|eukprot:Cvel_5571.t1-p1 / transcript=Cvel_5571.t1 / gene=Cvel_5571 / organism=Chromera_velia_CCMP2878 / gene_product=hypothetical protein / transcript_product=hypothetical protein / location=Cvel_scaffold261:102422-102967(-) / protein_length=73 / sequence_SO=supercontig / SO=protein_coding / is_pseudo=false